MDPAQNAPAQDAPAHRFAITKDEAGVFRAYEASPGRRPQLVGEADSRAGAEHWCRKFGDAAPKEIHPETFPDADVARAAATPTPADASVRQ